MVASIEVKSVNKAITFCNKPGGNGNQKLAICQLTLRIKTKIA